MFHFDFDEKPRPVVSRFARVYYKWIGGLVRCHSTDPFLPFLRKERKGDATKGGTSRKIRLCVVFSFLFPPLSSFKRGETNSLRLRRTNVLVTIAYGTKIYFSPAGAISRRDVIVREIGRSFPFEILGVSRSADKEFKRSPV